MDWVLGSLQLFCPHSIDQKSVIWLQYNCQQTLEMVSSYSIKKTNMDLGGISNNSLW
jgi:hypothetical protein